MLLNDPHFNSIVATVIGQWPLRELPERLEPSDAVDPKTLRAAFKRVMHCEAARKAKNIIFIWAVEKPYIHDSGNRLASTIAYIEITKNALSVRWPQRFFFNITSDYRHKGDAAADAGLEELARKDKNFSFYSRLIREHGPMRIWYANLEDIQTAGIDGEKDRWTSVRACEKALIQAYRKVHGVRPLKNRRD